MHLERARPALRDIKEAGDFIAPDSPNAAEWSGWLNPSRRFLSNFSKPATSAARSVLVAPGTYVSTRSGIR